MVVKFTHIPSSLMNVKKVSAMGFSPLYAYRPAKFGKGLKPLAEHQRNLLRVLMNAPHNMRGL
jgi:hypothetical protein